MPSDVIEELSLEDVLSSPVAKLGALFFSDHSDDFAGLGLDETTRTNLGSSARTSEPTSRFENGSRASQPPGRKGQSGSQAQPSYIDQLGPLIVQALRKQATDDVIEGLRELEVAKQSEIAEVAEAASSPFNDISQVLTDVKAHAQSIAQATGVVANQVNRAGPELVRCGQELEKCQRTKRNLQSVLEIVRLYLKALEHVNQATALLRAEDRVAAAITLCELRTVGLGRMRNMGLASILSSTIPGLTDLVANATTENLVQVCDEMLANGSPYGARARHLLSKQRQQWRETLKVSPHLLPYAFNSDVEKLYRATGENYFAATYLGLNLDPLYEAQLVYEKLGVSAKLRPRLCAIIDKELVNLGRRFSKSELTQDMIDSVVGFCLGDRAIATNLPEQRKDEQANEAWDALVSEIVSAFQRSPKPETPDDFELMRDLLCDARDILDNFGFDVSKLDTLLRSVLRDFVRHMLQHNKAAFEASWQRADHMPVVCQSEDHFDRIVESIWAADELIPKTSAKFPRALLFSEIVPLVCADLDTLVRKLRKFSDQIVADAAAADTIVQNAVDSYLADIVCHVIKDSLISTANREQLVQMLLDLRHFTTIAKEAEVTIGRIRPNGKRPHVLLRAVKEFEQAYSLAEQSIHKLVKAVVDDFLEMADYSWFMEEKVGAGAKECSTYAVELADFLTTMANSVLARLPKDLRGMVYLAAGDHLSTCLLSILQTAPPGMSISALAEFGEDVELLDSCISKLADSTGTALQSSLDEVRQALELLKAEDPQEYLQPQIRMKKYDRLRENVAKQLYLKRTSQPGTPNPGTTENKGGFMRRFLSPNT